MQRPLTPEFTFAGFTFPRYVATLAISIPALRRQRELPFADQMLLTHVPAEVAA